MSTTSLSTTCPRGVNSKGALCNNYPGGLVTSSRGNWRWPRSTPSSPPPQREGPADHAGAMTGRPRGIRRPGPGISGPAPGLRPTHIGCPAGQGKKGPGDSGPFATAERRDRVHQFRDRWAGQVDRGIPCDGLKAGAAGGPTGH